MQNTKKCFKCGEVKDLPSFYKHKKMKDGHLNKCKSCTKKDSSENRGKNLDYYREYDRSRGNRQDYSYVRSYRNAFPMKYAAHKMVGNAVRDGRLSKKYDCESCGVFDEKIHGHHDDYAKPLEVRWLCAACHKGWHKKNGEARNPK